MKRRDRSVLGVLIAAVSVVVLTFVIHTWVTARAAEDATLADEEPVALKKIDQSSAIPGGFGRSQHLLYAASMGHARTAAKLISLGVPLDVRNANGETPVCVAAVNGQQQVLSMLVKAGANVNVVDNDGFSPLMRAAANGYPECVRVLLFGRASTHGRNAHGETVFDVTRSVLEDERCGPSERHAYESILGLLRQEQRRGTR